MSLAGFKKQINKTRQRLCERIGTDKRTSDETDQEITEYGRKIDVVTECVKGVQTRTREYLHPNPTARTKIAVQQSYQKARGLGGAVKYPHPECDLAEVFSRFGGGLNDSSPYALSLVEVGSSFQQLSHIKDNLEAKVSQNFLQPLSDMQQRELKEISHHRKKLEGRRLDYDFKKGKGDKVTVDELGAAQSKFYESKDLCVNTMADFLDNDVQHITQLMEFTQSLCDYHKKCTHILTNLTDTLAAKLNDAASRPPRVEIRTVIPALPTLRAPVVAVEHQVTQNSLCSPAENDDSNDDSFDAIPEPCMPDEIPDDPPPMINTAPVRRERTQMFGYGELEGILSLRNVSHYPPKWR